MKLIQAFDEKNFSNRDRTAKAILGVNLALASKREMKKEKESRKIVRNERCCLINIFSTPFIFLLTGVGGENMYIS